MTFTEADASGNGYDGTYLIKPVFVPGLVPGNTAWTPTGGFGANAVTVPVQPISWVTAWSFECWVLIPSSVGSGGESLFISGVSGGSIVDINVGSTILTVTDQGDHSNLPWRTAAGAVSYDVAHHIVVTFDGTATVLAYVDGALVSWSTSGAHNAFWVAPSQNVVAGNIFTGIYDEFAVYTSVLSSGRVAAHHSAGLVSFAAYTAAVLADSPNVYYHFGSGPTGWIMGEIGIGP